MNQYRQYILLTLFALLHFKSNAQATSEIWTHVDKTSRNYVIYGLEADEKGNVYVFGNAYDTLWVETNDGTEIIASKFNNTSFIEKLDPQGNVLWVKNLSVEKQIYFAEIAVNKKGVITLSFAVYKEDRGKDYFIEQYNTDGELLLNKLVIADVYHENRCEIKGLNIGQDNAICLVGDFHNYAILKGTTDTLHTTNKYGSDSFILKLSSKGEYEWHTQITGYSSERIEHVVLDDSGNVFFAGLFDWQCILEKDTLKYDNKGSRFVCGKLNAQGEKEVFKTYQGNYEGRISSLKFDHSGNLFLCGSFKGELEMGRKHYVAEFWRESIPFIAKVGDQFEINVLTQTPTLTGDGGELYFGEEGSIFWLRAAQSDFDFDPSDEIVAFPPLGPDRHERYRIGIQKLDKDGNFLDLYLFPNPKNKRTFIRILDDQTLLLSGNRDFSRNEGELNKTYVRLESGLFDKKSPYKIRTCKPYFWPETEMTYETSGSYYSEHKSTTGTDSIIELQLTIERIDKTTRVDQKKIYSSAKDVTYQWLDCENNYKPIRGETDSIFEFRETGSYAVELTSIYCDIIDTSARVSVEMVGIHPADKRAYFEINYDVIVDKIEREHIQLNPDEVDMIPFRDGPLYGFVKKGKIDKWLIKPRFEQVFAVYKEGAIVKDTAKYYQYGMVNKKGKYLIPPVFENLFKENGIYHGILYVWKDTALNRLGGGTSHYAHYYYDEKGQLLFTERAHDAESFFYEDYAWFRFGKDYTVYNKKGELVKEFKVNRDKEFIGIADNKLLFYEDDKAVIAYDISGEVDFELPIRSRRKIYRLTPNLFGILADDADYYFCDSLGQKKPFSNTSNAIGFYQSDEAFFKREQFIVRDYGSQTAGVIDRYGEPIIEFKHSYIGPLINGFRYCIDSNHVGQFIDAKGAVLPLEDIYFPSMSYRNERMLLVQAYGFYDGLAISSRRPEWSDSLQEQNQEAYSKWWTESEYYSYYDTAGVEQVVLPDSIALAGNFSDGLAPALTQDKHLGFVDKKGNWIIEPRYELSMAGAYPMPYLVVPYFSNGFAYIKSFKGYIDKDGNEYFSGERMEDRYDFSH